VITDGWQNISLAKNIASQVILPSNGTFTVWNYRIEILSKVFKKWRKMYILMSKFSAGLRQWYAAPLHLPEISIYAS
jgi:hypothetical protein